MDNADDHELVGFGIALPTSFEGGLSSSGSLLLVDEVALSERIAGEAVEEVTVDGTTVLQLACWIG